MKPIIDDQGAEIPPAFKIAWMKSQKSAVTLIIDAMPWHFFVSVHMICISAIVELLGYLDILNNDQFVFFSFILPAS